MFHVTGWGQKVRYVPETRETKLFWRDIPGFCWDIPGVSEKFEKKLVFYLNQERKFSPQRKFWPDIPADIRPKTSVRPSESWETSILERTSRADVHEKTSV